MLKFAIFGAGRIGRMHAANLAGHKKAELLWVYDINQAAGDEVAASFGARSSSTTEEPLSDTEVDAVLIATSTDTHAPLIVESAKAGKAVFCEKPIDLSLEKVDWCRDQIRNLDVPVQIGFNRRFDPSHRKVALAAQNGEIGALEQVLISSRDPEPPPKEYYLVAGGMLRDMTIHDFDLARFVLNDEVEKVTALSATLFDPVAREIGEIDSVMILMQTESGKLCHINNSRHASYGYDQRLEADHQSDHPRHNGPLRFCPHPGGFFPPHIRGEFRYSIRNKFSGRYSCFYISGIGGDCGGGVVSMEISEGGFYSPPSLVPDIGRCCRKSHG